ncbi:hypothetical protein [Longimicrobium sp.]|uniref:hypothetical protein n=1 Tax=Longimicrobium sp. TaxID=2029185 RepID=UPI002C29CCF6|nr:hypothetical protein [Longimicrobium sp.]HSU17394.1 hypothetical protein [Longimicrobium sp.]
MLLQEVLTELPAEEVIQRARDFFSLRFTPYAGFAEEAGDSWIKFSTEAGDVTIGVGRQGERNLVRGSSSRLHHEVSQFLSTLAPPEEVRQSVPGPGVSGAG